MPAPPLSLQTLSPLFRRQSPHFGFVIKLLVLFAMLTPVAIAPLDESPLPSSSSSLFSPNPPPPSPSHLPPQCAIGFSCADCRMQLPGDHCRRAAEWLFCDTLTNKVDIRESAFLECVPSAKSGQMHLEVKHCARGHIFLDGQCKHPQSRYKRQGVAGSGRVGDFCSFNTDCLTGMFCSVGTCTCLSNFVAIQGYCYLKKNPGESGCQYAEQCSAVWPESRCEKSRCECPEDVNGIPYVQSKTRDGVVCVLHSGEDGDPVSHGTEVIYSKKEEGGFFNWGTMHSGSIRDAFR
uniref:EB domain-containing protein n=1 Tax=Globodera pallida TaxID=36090 RepID=A0A183BTQ2_GLOPA